MSGTHTFFGTTFASVGYIGQCPKIMFGAVSRNYNAWFYAELQGRIHRGTSKAPTSNFSGREQTGTQSHTISEAMRLRSWKNPFLVVRHAPYPTLQRRPGGARGGGSPGWLGGRRGAPGACVTSVDGSGGRVTPVEGTHLRSFHGSRQGHVLGRVRSGVGRSPSRECPSSVRLVPESRGTHKCQRFQGSPTDYSSVCAEGHHAAIFHRLNGPLLVSPQVGRSQAAVQRIDSPTVEFYTSQSHRDSTVLRAHLSESGGHLVSASLDTVGGYLLVGRVDLDPGGVQKLDSAGNRLDVKEFQCGVQQVRQSVSSAGGLRHRCLLPESNFTFTGVGLPAVQAHTSVGQQSVGVTRGEGSHGSAVQPARGLVEPIDETREVRSEHVGVPFANARRHGDTTTFRVDLGVCLREYYQLRGATNEEATLIINEIGKDTLKRYNSAWHMFGTFLLQDAALAPLLKVERFGQIPLMTVAVQLLKFSRTHSLSAGRMAYSAVCLFPCFSQLRFEGMLRNLKRDWFVSVPHYHRFYDVRRLIQVMHQQPVETEAQLRLQAILSLRFFASFRGVDMARSRRDIQRAAQPWFISAKRKGRRYYARYPIHNVTPPSIDPQRCLARFLEATGDYEGSEIFVSLRKPRKPLSSDTINGLTTRWLRKHLLELGELETDSFSAHSTRGAAATALIYLGVDPHVVAALGDWSCYDTFRKFYDRTRALLHIAQVLVPPDLATGEAARASRLAIN